VNICRSLATGPSPGMLVDVGWVLVFTGVLALLPIHFMRKRLVS
jgi:lipooligosaccharide transport system permease protein